MLYCNRLAAVHYLWQNRRRLVTKCQQREVPAWLVVVCPRWKIVCAFALSSCKDNWKAERATEWVSIYLLCCITVNHVRHERDLPVQEGGRSQVQWNLVCHHHCDVHSWRNSLNCPTWESTERIRNRGLQYFSYTKQYTHTHKSLSHISIVSSGEGHTLVMRGNNRRSTNQSV